MVSTGGSSYRFVRVFSFVTLLNTWRDAFESQRQLNLILEDYSRKIGVKSH